MERRAFLTGTIGALAVPRVARAQPPERRARIGFLSSAGPRAVPARLDAFRLGLREHGWIEGRNVSVDSRWAEGRNDRLLGLADELVALKVDVIVTHGALATLAARRATTVTPIVFASADEAVATGLVASLAHPGGNVTGLTIIASQLSGKRLELIREVIPAVRRVAVVRNPRNPVSRPELEETESAARSLGLEVQRVDVADAGDFAAGFSAMIRERAGAVIVLSDATFVGRHGEIVRRAAEHRLPAIYSTREFTDAGGLMSYGPIVADLWRRSAALVDKILKGARPGDLPVEQPTTFELVINLKTARLLGLTIPPSVLARADEVIE